MNKQNQTKSNQKTSIKNPSKTVLGKVAVWIILGIMVIVPTVTAIYLFVTSF